MFVRHGTAQGELIVSCEVVCHVIAQSEHFSPSGKAGKKWLNDIRKTK